MAEIKSSGVKLLHPEKLFAALPLTWEYFTQLGLKADDLESILKDSALEIRNTHPQLASDQKIKPADLFYFICTYMETCISLFKPYFKEKISGPEEVNKEEIEKIIHRSREEQLHSSHFSTLLIYGFFKYLFPTPEINQKDN